MPEEARTSGSPRPSSTASIARRFAGSSSTIRIGAAGWFSTGAAYPQIAEGRVGGCRDLKQHNRRMTAPPPRAMDEPEARRVLLAHAIETADARGELLAPAERDQADMRARHEALHRTGAHALRTEEFLALRARHVLGA